MLQTNKLQHFKFGRMTYFNINEAKEASRHVQMQSKDVLELNVTLTDTQGIGIDAMVTLFVDYNAGTQFNIFLTRLMQAYPQLVRADQSISADSLVGVQGTANSYSKDGYVRMSDFEFSVPAPNVDSFQMEDDNRQR